MLPLLLFILGLGLFSPRAKAACVDYLNLGDAACSAEGGCNGTEPVISCSFGCISGTCNGQGNGGLCCGQPFSTAQIFTDDGNCNVECGGPSTRRHRKTRTVARLKVDPETAFLAYRPPRLVFVPSSCEHVYAVLVEDYSPFVRNGGE